MGLVQVQQLGLRPGATGRDLPKGLEDPQRPGVALAGVHVALAIIGNVLPLLPESDSVCAFAATGFRVVLLGPVGMFWFCHNHLSLSRKNLLGPLVLGK